MEKKEATKAVNVIFSYYPLLTGTPGASYFGEEAVGAAEEIMKMQDELPSGSAVACLWVMATDDDGPRAILVMDQSDAIAEHFRYWSEEKPEEWFKFHFLEKGSSYSVALFPNLLKSVERYEAAFQLRYGYPPVTGSNVVLSFCPLHCVAKTKVAFDRAKKHLKSKVMVGLVGSDEISPENHQISMEQVRWLGEFDVVNENNGEKLAHEWLEGQIDDMLKETSEGTKL